MRPQFVLGDRGVEDEAAGRVTVADAAQAQENGDAAPLVVADQQVHAAADSDVGAYGGESADVAPPFRPIYHHLIEGGRGQGGEDDIGSGDRPHASTVVREQCPFADPRPWRGQVNHDHLRAGLGRNQGDRAPADTEQSTRQIARVIDRLACRASDWPTGRDHRIAELGRHPAQPSVARQHTGKFIVQQK